MTRGRIPPNIRLMGREKVITIIIGLVVGVALAGGIFLFWNNKDTLLNFKSTPPPQTPAPNIDVPSPLATPVMVDSPEDNLIVKERNLDVSGRGPTDAKILVVANTEEKAIKIDKYGAFKATIKLEEGENKISVIYFDQNNDPISINRTVTVEI